MGTLLVLALIGGIAWYFLSQRTKPAAGSGVPGRAARSVDALDRQVERIEQMKTAFLAEVGYLKERWEERERANAAGERCTPKWWWDEPTERQTERLKAELGSRGITMTFEPWTKGSVSDVIGLFEQPDDFEKDVLKFFKIPAKNQNQSRARYEVGRLLADPESKKRWDARPPDAEQKFFFDFFAIALPKGTTADGATGLRAEHERKLVETADPRMMEWEALEDIADQLDDPDTRELYEVRKLSRRTLRKALDELKAEGHPYEEVADDLDLLGDKIRACKQEA